MASATLPFAPLALVGMDACWGGCDGLEDFERMIYEARQQPSSLNGNRAAVTPAGEPLLGKSARRALQDAGIAPEDSGLRVAALACNGGPLELQWSWACSIEDLYGSPNPLAAALLRAQDLLQSGAADAVLFAAGAGQPRLPQAALLASGPGPAFGFDSAAHGWRLGEGAGTVVWMLNAHAHRDGRRVYAVIHSLAAARGKENGEAAGLPVPPLLEDMRACCRTALVMAGVSPGQVGCIEAFASGSDALDGIEIAGLAQAYKVENPDLITAVGSAQANAGFLGAAAGLAGLVRAALCLYHRMIPGAPGWSAPKLPALWRGTSFYIPVESRTWFQKANSLGRLAGVNTIGWNGACSHLILGEADRIEAQAAGAVRLPGNRALSTGGFYLFPLAGDSTADLLGELEDLQQALTYASDLNDLAAEYYEAAQSNGSAQWGLAVVGHDHEEIRREIEFALKAVPAVVDKATTAPGSEWQTPLGSYFTPQPAGRLGGVALVYPGAFNSYPGVGKDLFRLFPELHEQTARITGDLGGVIHERMLYPRSLPAVTKEAMAAIEARLLADPIAMLISGTTLAILYTQILLDTFKVRPQAAFGYSLGENSMMYAAGIWGQGDQAAARLAQSAAFRTRLAGPRTAIREYWGLSGGQADPDQPLWSNYLVMAPPEKVQAALEQEPRVYMTHINTPRQVVIGGDPQGCQRVLGALRASSLQAPFDYALHCEVMRSEYGALADLHDWPVACVPEMPMYSAANYAPLRIEQNTRSQKELAAAMAHMLTSPLDFPRLVNRVYEDGARVFIEAGAGGNCARWVDETLKGRAHLALSMNRRGTDDYTNLVRTLARLHSHRVPIDLSPLYTNPLERVSL